MTLLFHGWKLTYSLEEKEEIKMKRCWQLVFVSLLGSVLFLGGIPAVYSQEEASDTEVYTLDTIVVTATKREESILEVPISLTAFDGARIETLGMTGTDDIEQLTPGLQFGDVNEQLGQGTVIRGVGSYLHAETHNDFAVAFYVDEVYTHSTYGIAPNLFDVDRLEVARGPQGTLHGRNSIAGSISFFHKRPTDEWGADILAEFSDQFTQRYNAAFGGPIFDWLSFRLTSGYYNGDGAQENIGKGGDYDEPNQEYFAPQLRFKTDRLDINLRYSWTEDDGAPKTQVLVEDWQRGDEVWLIRNNHKYDGSEGLPIANLSYGYTQPVPSIADCDPGLTGNKCDDLQNIINYNAPGIQLSNRETWTLNVDFDITEGLLFRYTYGQSDANHFTSRDRDGLNLVAGVDGGFNGDPAYVGPGVPLWDHRYHFLSTVEEYSHEMQIISDFDGPFNFIAGAYYHGNTTLWEKELDNYGSNFRFLDAQEEFENSNATVSAWFPTTVAWSGIVPPASGFETCDDLATATWTLVELVAPGYFPPLSCTSGSDHLKMYYESTGAETETRAAFGHLDYQISDKLLVSGGVRYTEDKKKHKNVDQWQMLNLNDVFNFFGGVAGGVNIPAVYSWQDTFSLREFDTWNAWIWNVSAEYTLADNSMVYGRISKGYRAGAFNRAAPGFSPPKVNEEALINYEVGFKTISSDQRLLFTGAAFYSTYDDFQINAEYVIPAIGQGAPSTIRYTKNIDGTNIWGLELEGSYFVMEDFQLSGYYAYLDSEIGPHSGITLLDPNKEWQRFPEDCDVSAPPCTAVPLPIDMTGNQLPMQPNHKWALTGAYTVPMPLGMLQFLTTYSYTGERHPNIDNVPSSKMDGYGRWDIRATWTSESGRWSAGLFVQNVLDEIGLTEYLPVNLNTFRIPSLGTLTDPRRFGGFIRFKL